MSTDDRVAVKTYVPRHQKQTWVNHAEKLDMTQSEFVRTMVQAGRAEIDVPGSGSGERAVSDGRSDTSDGHGERSGNSSDNAVQSTDFADRIRTVLDRRGALEWDELVDALVDDVESELDKALQTLQANGEVVHSGRSGGYTLIDDE
ncbi:hypothetical protein Halru_1356 [Halovivax ruber XH-70]|uniref:Uncharacterized protein n=1 Tax=Halovivax ruber (strain DSM 18193 / JCM 13892 / XH-70) TaxID=797302 RepID=L0IB42_HALRX|nr:DUF5805 domain-containing protein [Halovivax ruber]AGB15969.1 hypothetical protein Halru_1356 [Halovivax ruber XH-70]